MKKRCAVDELRKEQPGIQRNQFDAEKKVAVADTSIQNLQRAAYQIKDEKQSAADFNYNSLETEKKEKEEELGSKENRSFNNCRNNTN